MGKNVLMPRVSIVMNCYNGERYLKEAIDSIYAQTYNDWEIIFWDNASTDRSAKIAQSFDNKLRYFYSSENVHLGAARKLAMDQVHGEWIGFLDTDDLWFPNKLEKQMEVLDYNNEYIMCYAGIIDISPNGEIIRELYPKYESGWQLGRQLMQFDINMVTPLIRKDALDRYNLTFNDTMTASEEYNLFIRMAPKGMFCTIMMVLGAWRISKGSLTDRQIECWYKERRRTLDQLVQENPSVKSEYKNELLEAFNRSVYYKSQYLASIGDFKGCRSELLTITIHDWKYFLLWLTAYIPMLWKLAHSTTFKRKLLPGLFGITNVK
jgi:glycosyltransferase involved in cell wall biosynthesis